MEKFDCVVIGGGPGGYTAAVRASQLGMKTALVEKENLGGTCLNWGCIPTKALLRNAEVIHTLKQGRTYGFNLENLSFDYGAAYKRSRSVVSRQTKRVAFLMKKNGIQVYEGCGRFINGNTIELEHSGQKLHAEHVIIATGSQTRQLPGVAYDGEKIINFRRALELTRVPATALIVGAGPIGMEFATIWSRYGSDVTVVELLEHALPLEDVSVSLEAEKQFKRKGIKVLTGSLVKSLRPMETGVNVTVESGETQQNLSVDTVLVAIGFTANSENLGLANIGIKISDGNIDIDERMCTSVPHIYAIGDVTGKMCLAHVASTQAMIAAEAIAGKPTPTLVYSDMPRCTYSAPEIASVGLTEAQAVEQGIDVISAQCPFVANGKAIASGDNSGFVKIVADGNSKKILGVHLVGDHVTELVAGATGMLSLNATVEQLGNTVHPHPTLSEALMEASHALVGHAIHI